MNLRNGNYIVLNNKPCKIINIDEEIHIKAIDILNGNEINKIFSKDDEVNIPHFNVYEYDVIGNKKPNKLIIKRYDEIEEIELPLITEDQKKLSETIIKNLLNNRKQKISVFESMGYKQIYDCKLVK
jgi:translation elongation factor P/translation initiation factor 5A